MTVEEFAEKKQFLLEKLSESIIGLEKIKELIEKNKSVENEDWVLVAKPFRDFSTNFLEVNHYFREH